MLNNHHVHSWLGEGLKLCRFQVTLSATSAMKENSEMATSSLKPAVVGALISIRANFTAPPMHPHDLKTIGLTFRRLVKSGINYHPDPVKDWLLNEGYPEEVALRVSDIAYYEQITANEGDYLASVIDTWREKGLNAGKN